MSNVETFFGEGGGGEGYQINAGSERVEGLKAYSIIFFNPFRLYFEKLLTIPFYPLLKEKISENFQIGRGSTKDN